MRGFDMFWIASGRKLFMGFTSWPGPFRLEADGPHAWAGSFYDLIFPFRFIVGVSTVFSLTNH
jgi:hypothetical protein